MAIVLALTALLAATDGQADRYAGRPLADALGMLQQRGLPIVYSSAVVTRSMVVAAEPRATDPRRVLDELLRPHRLEAKPGPGGVLQIVRAQSQPTRRRELTHTERSASDAPGREATSLAFDERVEVVARAEDARPGAVAASIVSGEELRTRTSVVADDALAALHTVPRVAATSDFRSEFSVRGSGPRHLAVVIDGIPASDMRHAVYGMRESAALTMISPEVVDRAALQVGAYPRRFSDALGGEVGITIREGSRTHARFSGAVGGVAATAVGEGPLRLAGPRSGQASDVAARGSWLLAVRQNFLDWPTTSFAAEYGGTGFGFRDLQAKMVYDVTDSQRVSTTVIAGQSLADNGDQAGPGGFFQGSHDALLVTSGWRSTVGEHVVVQQRAHVLSHAFHNTDPDGMTLMRARERRIGYRADVMRSWRGIALAAGGQFEHRNGSGHTSGFERASYVDARWSITPSLTVSPGLRVADASRLSHIAASPSLSVEWTTRAGWTLSAASGIGHQRSVQQDKPERARYFDVSIERPIGSRVRLEAGAYHRAERDVADPLRDGSVLTARARGAELALDLRPNRGLGGSVAYSYGRSRYTDPLTRASFWGDFDQRHAVNAFVSYQFARNTIAAAFRSGSNFPIAGYFTSRGGALFAGELRNAERRPNYARLDLKASRTFSVAGRDMTLAGEVLNVLNRTNFGAANGFIAADGAAVGFSETLMPRFASAALRIAF